MKFDISLEIMILSLLFLVIAIKVYKNKFMTESFIPEYEMNIENNKIIGWDPTNPINYRERKNFKPRFIFRTKNLKSRMWEHRFPSLVKQRYSYNETEDNNNYTKNSPVSGKARLKELSLDLQNRWHAKVSPELIKKSLYYQSNKRHDNKIKNISCPNKYYYNNLNRMNKIRNSQFESVSPFNPNDLLPAQYADRSKTSIEKQYAYRK